MRELERCCLTAHHLDTALPGAEAIVMKDEDTVYWGDDDDDDSLYVLFTPSFKKKIRDALPVIDDKKFDALVFFSEMAVENASHNYFLWNENSNRTSSKDHLVRIRRHIDALVNELYWAERAHGGNFKFWNALLANKRGNLTDYRWTVFTRISRYINIASLFLDKYFEGTHISYHNSEIGKKELDYNFQYNRSINHIADIYFTFTDKVPGRSKSTIGPFVRFAYQILRATTIMVPKSIDALNERWAKSDYVPDKIDLDRSLYAEYAEKKGIAIPF
jgi:hypothetical protein